MWISYALGKDRKSYRICTLPFAASTGRAPDRHLAALSCRLFVGPLEICRKCALAGTNAFFAETTDPVFFSP